MPVSRGKFLKQLGKSIPGLVLGSGLAGAAQTLLGKMAAASGEMKPIAVPEKKTTAPETKIAFIESGSLTGNQIALTFDDGPTPGVTELILDELARRQVKATFFMIGEKVIAAPDLAKRVLAEGHEIGNHTYNHPRLTTLPDREVISEIEKTQEVIRDFLNYRPTWFRPPFGELRQNQAEILASRGLGIVLWNVDTRDWTQPGVDQIVATALKDSKAGSILVCHDLYRQTADSIGLIIDRLHESGFSFVTLTPILPQTDSFSK